MGRPACSYASKTYNPGALSRMASDLMHPMLEPFATKKSLGQHFLHHTPTAQAIVALLGAATPCSAVVEIGPGTGALTRWLVDSVAPPLYLVETDKRLIPMLQQTYARPGVQVIHADFLTFPLEKLPPGPLALIGNFPYHISSPIAFKVLHHRQRIQTVVGMLQHEVAARITAPPGSRTYGLLSVLLQAFYEVTYCFAVPPHYFTPPPKVTSAVVQLKRNKVAQLDCDEKRFFQVVKASFSQRRKMLRNTLPTLGLSRNAIPPHLATQRAETLSATDFIALTQALYGKGP